jgi:hypothetical protein
MLQYEGGVGAFVTGAETYRIDLDDMAAKALPLLPEDTVKESRDFLKWTLKQRRTTYGLPDDVYVVCNSLKSLWRAAHPAISSYWKELQQGFISAVNHPGEWFPVRRVAFRKDGAWLRIRLPSGRFLCYPQPQVDDSGSCSYMGMNQYTRQWQRLGTYGGKLFENCVAEGTPVMTSRGWVPIQQVGAEDRVWDGVEWVVHGGLKYSGKQLVILAHGARMTPEHLVLTEGGWQCASSSERYNRVACRIPNRYAVRGIRWKEVLVGGWLRLWQESADACNRAIEAQAAGGGGVLRLSSQGIHCDETHTPRHERAPRLQGMAKHAGPLPLSHAPGIPSLWGERHKCVPLLAILSKLLGGHGRHLHGGEHLRTKKQRPGVFPRELRMAHTEASSQQHPKQCLAGYAFGADDDSASSGLLPHRAFYPRLQDKAQLAGSAGAYDAPRHQESKVYDLMDCGPRNRFAIRSEDGTPLIVHNCCQASARDVMAHAMPIAEEQGYEVVLTVHDELITEAPDDLDHSVDGLAGIMATVPEWAEGLPLAAAGFEAYRYRKD